MGGPITRAAKRLFRMVGLDVRRVSAADEARLLWLRSAPVRTILDIGANTGQFAATIHDLLPHARIYSFEPLPDCYSQLVRNMSGVPQFRAFNVALGDHNGEAMIHRHTFTPSSSLLPSTTLLRDSFPATASEEPFSVSIARLDGLVDQLQIEDDLLVKIDVQGYEHEVIRGGRELLSRAQTMIVETSFVSLYQGQSLFHAVYHALRELDFVYAGSLEQIVSPADGRILQADALFLKHRSG